MTEPRGPSAGHLGKAVEKFLAYTGDLRRYDGQAISLQFQDVALQSVFPDIVAELRCDRLHNFYPNLVATYMNRVNYIPE